ncbi:DUF2336 domain-containing protein [Chelativorans sp. AA-79]|uniref:DUF2336 domain-containing protein n=1 Tax=Chelativorans sp. AA-79 TaxID=3028735 RepID=UPI0023F798DB|nr:DUF2336 domain-containing protein [Chelativorans sp. AA-79]WEX07571.1 DUF2336 domain-containing protein [Chelativorans sp. AA-79]
MSVVQYFLKWIPRAKVSERVPAAAALARAYLRGDLPFEERLAAEAALTLLADDPSPQVRLALAEALSLSHKAPAQVVAALAGDQPEVAAPILIRSPILSDVDLVDLVAMGCAKIQALIASRPSVSMAVSAAVAEVGEVDACLALLRNGGAQIAGLSFRRMIERHGAHAAMRAALTGDRRLPSDCRHLLLVRAGAALSSAPFVLALVGHERAEKLTREACIRASITLVDATATNEHSALVEHLRLRGELTSGFLVRAVAHGKIDFFAAALVALTGARAARVHSILSGGRDGAVKALLGKAGLKQVTHLPIVAALKIWRQVANAERIAGPQEATWHMLKALEADAAAMGTPTGTALAGLLRRIHLEALRENARQQAQALAA